MQPEKLCLEKLNEVTQKYDHYFSIFCTACWCSCVMSKRSRADGSRSGQQLYSYSGQLWRTVLFLMTSSSQFRSLRAHRGVWCPTVDLGGGQRRGCLQRASQPRSADGDSVIEKIRVVQEYFQKTQLSPCEALWSLCLYPTGWLNNNHRHVPYMATFTWVLFSVQIATLLYFILY